MEYTATKQAFKMVALNVYGGPAGPARARAAGGRIPDGDRYTPARSVFKYVDVLPSKTRSYGVPAVD